MPGAEVAPLPVTVGILATSASASRRADLAVAARRLDQPRRHALLVVEQRLEIMRRANLLVMLAHRDGLRRLQEAARAVGQFFKIHRSPLSCPRMWCVSPSTQELLRASGSDGSTAGCPRALASPADDRRLGRGGLVVGASGSRGGRRGRGRRRVDTTAARRRSRPQAGAAHADPAFGQHRDAADRRRGRPACPIRDTCARRCGSGRPCRSQARHWSRRRCVTWIAHSRLHQRLAR